ncbi:MAG: nucleoside phosphorylase [Clostridiales Family XIII bacterium]|jgi:uridine phosphorylase|nr:nucleoside phosphorylase [Clostridiales Family XIII bacterium]
MHDGVKNKAGSPKTAQNGVWHLNLSHGDIPPYVILPGAPERTEVIAKKWDHSEFVTQNREFKTIRGTYQEMPIATVSTGIGGPSSEICINELSKIGVHTCIRVGTTGCLQAQYDLGDLIIAVAAVRKDGTSDTYIGSEYPAYAHPIVVMALMTACDKLGYRYGLGLDYTTASFYTGQARPIHEDGTGYYPSFLNNLLSDLTQAGVTNIEMETATQFVVGKLHDMRMGAVLSVISNRVTDEWGDAGGEEKSTLVASEALRILSDWDARGEIDFHCKMPTL